MTIKRTDGTLLYIPREKINHIQTGPSYKGMTHVYISLDYLHGLSDGWDFPVSIETAERIVEELRNYEDADFEEGT